MTLPLLKVGKPPASPAGDALADFLAAQSARYWLDHADASTHYQERTGSPPATLSGADGVVGSVLNKGSVGGYVRAPSDGARGIYRTVGRVDMDGSDDIYNASAKFTAGDEEDFTLAVALRATNSTGVLGGDAATGFAAIYQDGSGSTGFAGGGISATAIYVNGSLVTTRNAFHDAIRDVDAVVIALLNSAFNNATLYGSDGNSLYFGGRAYQIAAMPGHLDSSDRATLTTLMAGRIPA